MKILGIDTSCDDTCISVIKAQSSKFKTQNFEILSNIVSSQVKLHAKYGGVYPALAKREHIKNLPLVFRQATKGIKPSEIDLISVTNGPGLEPCLWQGVNFARDLAKKLKKPLIPINHIEAHIIANFINLKSEIPAPYRNKVSGAGFNLKSIFSAVCLVVSGGHTQLILMKGIGQYKLISETRDDAAGECFDKVARILGLGYPGGPIVAKSATQFQISNFKFKIVLPRPMMYQKNYDFSFSGLKTAVLYKVQSMKSKETKKKEFIRAMCAETQQAIIDVLIHKTIKAAKDFKVKSIILGGGVAANDELRKQFNLKIKNLKLKINFLVPPKNLCTDNAAMIAAVAYFSKREANRDFEKIKVDANLKI